MSGSVGQLVAICKDCLLFSSSGLFMAYGILVLLLSFTPSAGSESKKAKKAGRSPSRRPPIIGEIGEITAPRPSVAALVLQLVLKIASFRFFAYLVATVLAFIRAVFFMRDKPSFGRSFLRYFLFYFVIIPLPAAFMPPVGDLQRKPDFQLMFAVVLLIVINALGDAISVRVTLRKFGQLKFEKTTIDELEGLWQEAKKKV